MVTGNKHRDFGEIWTCRFWDVRAKDKQTNKQTKWHADYNT